MDTLHIQHQLQLALLKQIENTARSAALLTPEVACSVAAIKQDLSGTVSIQAGPSNLDISIRAPSDTHPDALLIALDQHLPTVDRYNRWVSHGHTGQRHICMARAGSITYTCDSEITLPQSDSESA